MTFAPRFLTVPATVLLAITASSTVARAEPVQLASATELLSDLVSPCDDGSSCASGACSGPELTCAADALGCSGCGGWFMDAEATYFQYHRADGVRFGTSGPVEVTDFDFEIAPRITIGHCGGAYGGFRARWWDYDHFASGRIAGQGLRVETVVWDFEWFDTIFANHKWAVEVSAGLRYNEFTETMIDSGNEFRINDFDGFGAVLGSEVHRAFWKGTVYARGKYAILTGDKFIRNDNAGGGQLTLNDTVQSVSELAIGYQQTRRVWNNALLVTQFGVEWQQWDNYSSGFRNTMPGGEDFSGPSDVGFAGFTSMVGLYY